MPVEPGRIVPAAALRDPSGGEVALAEVGSGRPALLLFHKADCPATEVAARVLPRFAAVPGLVLAAVSQDGIGEARALAARSGWDPVVRLLLDPEPWPASGACGIRATPTWILLAPGGRVEMVAEGWARDDANALAARAGALCGAPPVVVARPGGPEPALRPG